MTHWPAALNTIIGLILGGGLTMAGQALTDRRARRQEREARRETFLMQNFTAQQEALMRIQERVEEFSARLNAEYLREYEQPPPFLMKDIIPAAEGATSDAVRMAALLKQLSEPIPEDERVIADREIAQLMNAMETWNGKQQALNSFLERRHEFI